MSDNLIDINAPVDINDPVVKEAEKLLDVAHADYVAGKLTKAEFDEIVLDIFDFQKIADLVSDAQRRATIYNTYKIAAAVLHVVLPLV